MRKKYLVAVAGVLVLALAGLSGLASAKSGKGPNHIFDLTFTTKGEGKATGIKKLVTDRYAYKPQPVGQPADPATSITFQLPKGSKLDFSVIPAKRLTPCHISKLGSSGDPVAAKCVELTKGTGEATAIVTGLQNPITVKEDVKLYAGARRVTSSKRASASAVSGAQIILRLRQRPGQVGQTANIPIDANSKGKLVAKVPKFCSADNANTPFCDVETVLTKIVTAIKKVSKGKKALLRTPKTCPKSKKWTSTVTYKYVTTKTEKVKATTPCKR